MIKAQAIGIDNKMETSKMLQSDQTHPRADHRAKSLNLKKLLYQGPQPIVAPVEPSGQWLTASSNGNIYSLY